MNAILDQLEFPAARRETGALEIRAVSFFLFFLFKGGSYNQAGPCSFFLLFVFSLQGGGPRIRWPGGGVKTSKSVGFCWFRRGLTLGFGKCVYDIYIYIYIHSTPLPQGSTFLENSLVCAVFCACICILICIFVRVFLSLYIYVVLVLNVGSSQFLPNARNQLVGSDIHLETLGSSTELVECRDVDGKPFRTTK